ncbi:MAG: ISAs1 family transposase [Verrucomicrobiales bacterium]|nr:ISAs1 family transposase [Verrucomicrobiales bacterium]
MQDAAPLSLTEHFKDLPDPRVKGRCEHELLDVMVIALCCLLCGGSTFNDMEDFGHAKEAWFRTFLRLPKGIPRHDTFNRVFASLKPAAFLDCLLRWTQSLRQAVAEEIVALDGKALRRAGKKGQAVCYVVNAWASANGLVLGQLKVAEKSNEITALPPLLRALELAGYIVTIDAMGCQKKIAKEIIEADADYVLALKGNHETVNAEVKSFLDDAIVQQEAAAARGHGPRPTHPLAFAETVEKDHGRLEIRRHWQSADLGWFADRADWEGLRSVGVVESLRQEGEQAPTLERRYYLSSLPVGIDRFARAVREHWGVENRVHWVLDVQFGEDQSRARAGHAAENLATLRRLALNLLRRDKTKGRGIRRKRLNAGWDHQYLLQLLAL